MTTGKHTPDAEPAHLAHLTRAECLALLQAGDIGRVVVARDNKQPPVIRPVNYLFDIPSQSVVFRTAEGTKLHALIQAARAAFEVDEFHPHTRTGWSVIIVGFTHLVSEPAEIRRLDDAGLTTWAPGKKAHWVQIRARTVTGRRVDAL